MHLAAAIPKAVASHQHRGAQNQAAVGKARWNRLLDSVSGSTLGEELSETLYSQQTEDTHETLRNAQIVDKHASVSTNDPKSLTNATLEE